MVNNYFPGGSCVRTALAPRRGHLQWFCLVFNNQFKPDELLDNYPVDRLMHDIALTLMAVQSQTTSILSEFPTKAAEAATTEATA